jgi:hypothetical protein
MNSTRPACGYSKTEPPALWLDAMARPLQEVVNQTVWRMAGLADNDIMGLEKRLAKML